MTCVAIKVAVYNSRDLKAFIAKCVENIVVINGEITLLNKN